MPKTDHDLAKPKQNVIGIVYDFDETLSPNNMQEDTIFRSYGIDKEHFWLRAKQLVDSGYERTLAYLKLLISDPPFDQKPLSRKKLKESAKFIELYPGVESFFSRINDYVANLPEAKKHQIKVEHYIISSGMKEILEGIPIYEHFKRVYACEYEYNEKGHPIFPKIVINDTNKTQFLFRINKGLLDISEDINDHMPAEERPIPFENMIYIGDSTTDIPSMTIVNREEGHTIAVFDAHESTEDKYRRVGSLIKTKRASQFAGADYQAGSLLDKILKQAIHKIVHTMVYRFSARLSYEWVNQNLK